MSKPLPPRSKTCVSRPSECVYEFFVLHAVCQSSALTSSHFSHCYCWISSCATKISQTYTLRKSYFGRVASRLGNSLNEHERIPALRTGLCSRNYIVIIND